MNESETNSPAQTELMDQMVALRHQVFTLLLALVVVSGTLTVYLYRQASLTGKDIEAIKPQATQIIEAFKREPQGMENFVKQLTAYGVHASRLPAHSQKIRDRAAIRRCRTRRA